MLFRIFIGIFFILHGLIHLLYAGHSRRLFEIQEGLTWPDGAWAFSDLISDRGTRSAASISYLVAAILFVISGIAMIFNLGWWSIAVIIASIFSGVIIILFWNGKLQKLADQGGIGLLINITILVGVLLL
jgi:uncharacterized membrane protein YphA (DoxX/SURF4 family)